MRVAERIKICRLIEKAKKNKDMALAVGIKNKSMYKGIPINEINKNNDIKNRKDTDT